MLRTFDQIIEAIRLRMATDLPGADAQVRMAPLRDDALERLRVEERACREAGVLVALISVEDTPHVIFTVRRDDLTEHPGQVSFPGGRREPGESLCEAALREAYEEVSLPPDDVEILGEMTPLFVPPSNYCVYPFLGFVPHRPVLRPDDYEVAQIVEIPLPLLLDAARIRREPWILRDESVLVPYFDIAGLKIWGATAMMLSELVVLAREAGVSSAG